MSVKETIRQMPILSTYVSVSLYVLASLAHTRSKYYSSVTSSSSRVVDRYCVVKLLLSPSFCAHNTCSGDKEGEIEWWMLAWTQVECWWCQRKTIGLFSTIYKRLSLHNIPCFFLPMCVGKKKGKKNFIEDFAHFWKQIFQTWKNISFWKRQ